jgi:hypothetical protein
MLAPRGLSVDLSRPTSQPPCDPPRNSSTSAAYVSRSPSPIETSARHPNSRAASDASRQLCCSSPGRRSAS